MEKVSLIAKDRDYFKNGVKGLSGIEVIRLKNIINNSELTAVFTSKDLKFMNKELARQSGMVFDKIIRAFKKMDFEEAKRMITGGESK